MRISVIETKKIKTHYLLNKMEIDEEPQFVMDAAQSALNEIIPSTSRNKFNKVYDDFVKWKTLTNAKSTSETVVMAYLYELAKRVKPSSNWAYYSMLKSTIRVNEKIDIGKYTSVSAFLKSRSSGYKPVKAKVFSEAEIKKFISEADDSQWLDVKVVCIFGMSGGLRSDEFPKITLDDIENHGRLLLIKIPVTKTKISRQFTITGSFFDVVQKYFALRVPATAHTRFFVNYRLGRCTTQPIGKHKFSKMPREIAVYLNLKDPDSYKGHSFRRTSASILANAGAAMEVVQRHGGWKSATVAAGYIDDSLKYKTTTGKLIESTITSSEPICSQGYAEHARDIEDISDNVLVALKDDSFQASSLENMVVSDHSANEVVAADSLNNKLDDMLTSFKFQNCSVTFHMK